MTFNAQEIFEMAIQIERDGEAFYRKAATELQNPEEVKLMNDLAVMEVEHEKIFTRMKESYLKAETEPFDPDGDAMLYLRSLAAGRVFDPKRMQGAGEIFLTGNESPAEILEKAIGLEKESISFYVGMQHLVPEDLGQSQIAEIIREEMRHVIMLRKELNRMTPNN